MSSNPAPPYVYGQHLLPIVEEDARDSGTHLFSSSSQVPVDHIEMDVDGAPFADGVSPPPSYQAPPPGEDRGSPPPFAGMNHSGAAAPAAPDYAPVDDDDHGHDIHVHAFLLEYTMAVLIVIGALQSFELEQPRHESAGLGGFNLGPHATNVGADDIVHPTDGDREDQLSLFLTGFLMGLCIMAFLQCLYEEFFSAEDLLIILL